MKGKDRLTTQAAAETAPPTATPITHDQVREEVAWIEKCARDHITDRKYLRPCIFVACRANPIDGEPLDSAHCLVPLLFAGDFGDTRARQKFIDEARAVAIAGDALACVTVAETVCVLDQAMSVAEAKSIDIANHPGRKDSLMVVIEWCDRAAEVKVCAIVRDQGFVDFDEVAIPAGEPIVDVAGDMRIMCAPGTVYPDGIVTAAREITKDVVSRISVTYLGPDREGARR